MTPELRSEFETSWRDLHPRLHAMLLGRGIRPDRHDDLIQETALRLYGMWERVDRSRPSWPLAKTIVLNLLRDECRTNRVTEPLDEFPEQAFDYDLERQGIARIELDRVREALGSLTDLQRRALLVEIGVHPAGDGGAADKMVRMRARKRLTALLEEVSALVSLRWVRLPDLLQGVGLLRPAGNAAIACFACIFGASVLAINTGPLATEAEARPQDRVVQDRVLDGVMSGIDTASLVGSDLLVRDSLQPARSPKAASDSSEAVTGKRGKAAASAADADEAGSGGSTETELPSTSDLEAPRSPSEDVPEVPDTKVSVESDGLPGSDSEGESGPPAVEDVERAATAVVPLSSLDPEVPELEK